MLNLPAKQNNIPYVLGGNLNNVLKTWLKEIGVMEFAHGMLAVTSINPEDIKISAGYIQKEYGAMYYLFTVGAFADKVVTAANLPHGALPPTSCTDKKKVAIALNECRTYLLRRAYAQTSYNPNISS